MSNRTYKGSGYKAKRRTISRLRTLFDSLPELVLNNSPTATYNDSVENDEIYEESFSNNQELLVEKLIESILNDKNQIKDIHKGNIERIEEVILNCWISLKTSMQNIKPLFELVNKIIDILSLPINKLTIPKNGQEAVRRLMKYAQYRPTQRNIYLCSSCNSFIGFNKGQKQIDRSKRKCKDLSCKVSKCRKITIIPLIPRIRVLLRSPLLINDISYFTKEDVLNIIRCNNKSEFKGPMYLMSKNYKQYIDKVINNGDIFLVFTLTCDGISIFSHSLSEYNKSSFPILLKLLNYNYKRQYDKRTFWTYTVSSENFSDNILSIIVEEFKQLEKGIDMDVYIHGMLQRKKVVSILLNVSGDCAAISSIGHFTGSASSFPCRCCELEWKRDDKSFHQGINSTSIYYINSITSIYYINIITSIYYINSIITSIYYINSIITSIYYINSIITSIYYINSITSIYYIDSITSIYYINSIISIYYINSIITSIYYINIITSIYYISIIIISIYYINSIITFIYYINSIITSIYYINSITSIYYINIITSIYYINSIITSIYYINSIITSIYYINSIITSIYYINSITSIYYIDSITSIYYINSITSIYYINSIITFIYYINSIISIYYINSIITSIYYINIITSIYYISIIIISIYYINSIITSIYYINSIITSIYYINSITSIYYINIITSIYYINSIITSIYYINSIITSIYYINSIITSIYYINSITSIYYIDSITSIYYINSITSIYYINSIITFIYYINSIISIYYINSIITSIYYINIITSIYYISIIIISIYYINSIITFIYYINSIITSIYYINSITSIYYINIITSIYYINSIITSIYYINSIITSIYYINSIITSIYYINSITSIYYIDSITSIYYINSITSIYYINSIITFIYYINSIISIYYINSIITSIYYINIITSIYYISIIIISIYYINSIITSIYYINSIITSIYYINSIITSIYYINSIISIYYINSIISIYYINIITSIYYISIIIISIYYINIITSIYYINSIISIYYINSIITSIYYINIITSIYYINSIISIYYINIITSIYYINNEEKHYTVLVNSLPNKICYNDAYSTNTYQNRTYESIKQYRLFGIQDGSFKGIKCVPSCFERLSYFDTSSSFPIDTMHLFNNIVTLLLSLLFHYNSDKYSSLIAKTFLNNENENEDIDNTSHSVNTENNNEATSNYAKVKADKIVSGFRLNKENMNILNTRINDINTFYNKYEYEFRFALNEKKFWYLSSHTRIFFFSVILPLITNDFNMKDSPIILLINPLATIIRIIEIESLSLSNDSIDILQRQCYLFCFLCDLLLPKEIINSQIHLIQHLSDSIKSNGSSTYGCTYQSERFYSHIKRMTFGRLCFNESSLRCLVQDEICNININNNVFDINNNHNNIDYPLILNESQNITENNSYSFPEFRKIVYTSNSNIVNFRGLREASNKTLNEEEIYYLLKELLLSGNMEIKKILLTHINIDNTTNLLDLLDSVLSYTRLKENMKLLQMYYYSEILVNENLVFTSTDEYEGIEKIDNSYIAYSLDKDHPKDSIHLIKALYYIQIYDVVLIRKHEYPQPHKSTTNIFFIINDSNNVVPSNSKYGSPFLSLTHIIPDNMVVSDIHNNNIDEESHSKTNIRKNQSSIPVYNPESIQTSTVFTSRYLESIQSFF
ncbi:hypothetical protein WA158_008458 [Blastocystis sp. Blastoise]